MKHIVVAAIALALSVPAFAKTHSTKHHAAGKHSVHKTSKTKHHKAPKA